MFIGEGRLPSPEGLEALQLTRGERTLSPTAVQLRSSAARAPSAPPVVQPSASATAFIAPALVPLMPSIGSLPPRAGGRARPRYAPCAPPPAARARRGGCVLPGWPRQAKHRNPSGPGGRQGESLAPVRQKLLVCIVPHNADYHAVRDYSRAVPVTGCAGAGVVRAGPPPGQALPGRKRLRHASHRRSASALLCVVSRAAWSR